MALAQGNTTQGPSDATTGWAPSPAGRSTLDIVWSCLSIFLVCSWKCVHLNLPTPAESLGEWHRLYGVPYLPKRPLRTKWARQLAWMGAICLAPELGVALAVRQWLGARDVLENADMQYEEYQGGFTMAHAFYGDMGGITLLVRRDDAGTRAAAEALGRSKGGESAATNTEGDDPAQPQYDEMVVNLRENAPSSPLNAEAPSTDTQREVALARRDPLPRLSEADISDRSKSDAFTKAFALAQCTWLVVQSAARAAQGLAISELELATMAFILCAAVMYGFWWHKPFGVERRTVVVATKSATSWLVPLCEPRERVGELSMSEFRTLVLENDIVVGGMISKRKLKWELPTLALYVSGMAFSAVHFAAWNWEFPSPLIQALWRWFSVVASVSSFLPALQYLAFKLVMALSDEVKALGVAFYCIACLLLVCYVTARLGLLFLTFYCFSSMPASVYETVDWTGYIPHFS